MNIIKIIRYIVFICILFFPNVFFMAYTIYMSIEEIYNTQKQDIDGIRTIFLFVNIL